MVVFGDKVTLDRGGMKVSPIQTNFHIFKPSYRSGLIRSSGFSLGMVMAMCNLNQRLLYSGRSNY